MNKEEYKEYVKRRAKRSSSFKNCVFAFLIGGFICVIGQALMELYTRLGATTQNASTLVSISLISVAALLTGLGLFDKIAKLAGAGTLVPITGFSNAVVSPAIDTRSEGYIFGVGAKIFTIAGPVILYGIFTGVIYGIIYYLFG
ncbi:MAG: stage V sporulation protein AC [Clostridia bacterium]|nr:stage V sporulation protein AC [Clostridia bacterium]